MAVSCMIPSATATPPGGQSLGAAIYAQRVARHPARGVGGEEGDGAGDVVRLGHTLQRLHPEREFAPGFGPGEARHIGLHDPRRDGVHSNTPGPRIRAKCLTRLSIAPLVAAYADRFPMAACAASEEVNTMLEPSFRMGSSC